jgi:hypothetical protein
VWEEGFGVTTDWIPGFILVDQRSEVNVDKADMARFEEWYRNLPTSPSPPKPLTNAELIERLQKLPPDKTVTIFVEGGARWVVEGIVNNDSEIVIVGDWGGGMYRTGEHRAYPEENIVYDRNPPTNP